MTTTTPLDRWRASHRLQRAALGEPVCGDRSSVLRPEAACDLPAGHDGAHESEYGFWAATEHQAAGGEG